MPAKSRSLRVTLLGGIIIPGIAVTFVLLGVICLGGYLIKNEIVARQKLLVETVARQGNQYLAETGRIMELLAVEMPKLSPPQQTQLLNQTRKAYPRFTALYLLDETGTVSAEATDFTPLKGLDLSGEPFFQNAALQNKIYFSDPFISLNTGQVAVTAAIPILINNHLNGMVVGEMNLELLQQTIEQVNLEEGSLSFVVDNHGTLVAHPNPIWVQERRNIGNLSLVQQGLANRQAFEFFNDDTQNLWLLGSVTPMTEKWVVVTTQPLQVAARPLFILVITSVIAFTGSLLFFIFFQTYALKQTTSPLMALVKRADALGAGQYNVPPTTSPGNYTEIISLNQSFNRMAEAVIERDHLLEQRVAERTQRLQIVASLGEQLNAILDPDKLISVLVEQIDVNFGYYFASIFLLDDREDMLVAQAAVGEIGRALLAEPTTLKLSSKGVITRAARTGKVILVNDVSQETDWLYHPLTPNTKSEIAVPIIVENKVVGVLDVQEDKVAAFEESDIDLFRSLANQAGVALHNARLYTKMENLVAERTAELSKANQALEYELQERQRLEEQARQSQKLEAVGLLAGGIAHDFNNLLVPIIGYVDLALMRVPPHDELHQDLIRIKNAAERAANLTRQILAFSRRQVLEIKTFDLNQTVENFEAMIQRLIGEDIKIQTALTPLPCLVRADKSQVEQILMNLALNARDAMPNGGTLTLKTANATLNEHHPQQLQDVQPGHYALLTVSDTGHGMDTETADKIFDPFFTTKEVGKGTGLGLATTFGIVKQHNGHILVNSRPNQGTTFEVYLPQADHHQMPLSKTQSAVNQTVPGSETILVVEDEAMVRDLVCKTLQSHGYNVLEAQTPGDGLALAITYPNSIHLLLTDVIMPEMNGMELYKQIALNYPEIKVIYMSGYTDDVIMLNGSLQEDQNFLQKPFAIQELTQKIRSVLE